jgi:hypothetical protein
VATNDISLAYIKFGGDKITELYLRPIGKLRGTDNFEIISRNRYKGDGRIFLISAYLSMIRKEER